MSHSELMKEREQEISIPVYSRGKQVDTLVAVSGSQPVRIKEGMQFTDSFGIHPAQTTKEYGTPLTVEATLMTDSTNIVLQFANGEVILNWDRREDMLRVRHPVTKQPFDLPGKGAVPAGRWHHLEWIIAEDVMRVLVNGEERFALLGNYRGLQGKIGVRTGWRANLSVGSLLIEQHIGAEEPTAGTDYRAVPHRSSFVGCMLGAMSYCNRYAEEIELLGGIGYWFRPILPQEPLDNRFSAEVQELLKPFGLNVRYLAAYEETELDVFQFIEQSLEERQALFGYFGEQRGYAAVIGTESSRLRMASPDGEAEIVGIQDVVELFAVRPDTEALPREKVMTAFRWAAEHGKKSMSHLESAWLAALETTEAASSQLQAAALADRRRQAALYLRNCLEAVGGTTLAEQLESAARSYELAGSTWSTAAELLAADTPSEAGGFVSKAVAAETEGARVLGETAAALAGKKRLEGLRYWGYSCISQHNTLKGLADYYRIPGSDAWILGASGRPFAFAVHERVNVHDICLPIPEHHFIRLFANLGLAIHG